MPNATPLTLDQRKARWREFYEISAPARHVFFIGYDDSRIGGGPQPYAELRDERIEHAWKFYVNRREQAEWLDDDYLPHIAMWTGTELFAEAFGCPVHRYETGNPCAMPLIRNVSEFGKIKMPDLSAEPIARVFDIMDELHRRDPAALMMMVDIQSPMDIAALIWDKTDFYMAILDEPQAVKDLARMTTDLLIAFHDEWFSRYGTEFIAHYPDYFFYNGLTLSEDEIGAVSEDMFCELFLPLLVELSDRYGGMGMHCCANAQHQWPHLLKIPNLRLLNLVQDMPVIDEAHKFFASRLGQMHDTYHPAAGPVETLKRFPEGVRAVVRVSADSKEQAIDYAAQMRELCG